MELLNCLHQLLQNENVEKLFEKRVFLNALYKYKDNNERLNLQIIQMAVLYEHVNLIKTLYPVKHQEGQLITTLTDISRKLEKKEISSYMYAYPLNALLAAMDIEVDTIEWIDPRSKTYGDLLKSKPSYGIGLGSFVNDTSVFTIDSTTLKGYAGQSIYIVIPHGVTTIDEFAFANQKKLQFVILPDTIQTLGKGCFKGCDALKYVNIPKHLRHIPDDCFNECTKLSDIFVDQYESIGKRAFRNTSVVVNTFNANLTSIGSHGFENIKNLKKINLPSSLKTIGTAPFSMCASVEEVSLYFTGLSVNSHGEDGKFFHLFSESLDDYNQNYNVKRIELLGNVKASSFTYHHHIEKIMVKNHQGSIGEHAFLGCKDLEGIRLEGAFTNIGQKAFMDCKQLQRMTLISEHRQIIIEDQAFENCTKLTECNLPDYAHVHNRAFYGCQSLDIETRFEQSLTLGSECIGGIACEHIRLPFVGHKEDDKHAHILHIFSKTSFNHSIKVEKTTSDGSVDAYHVPNSLIKVTIHRGIIPDKGFSHMHMLQDIILSDGITHIGEYAFTGCDNIKTMNLPASLNSMKAMSFYGMKSLERIKVDTGNEKYIDDEGSLFTKEYQTIICYPPQKRHAHYILPATTQHIFHGAFNHASWLTHLTLSPILERIGVLAFENCNQLKELILPQSVQIIYREAFKGCESLTALNIGHVSYIEEGILKAATSIESLVFNFDAKTVDNKCIEHIGYLFGHHEGFNIYQANNFAIPQTLSSLNLKGKHIPPKALLGLSSVQEITLDDHMESIGAEAFSGLSIEHLSLPESISYDTHSFVNFKVRTLKLSLSKEIQLRDYFPTTIETLDIFKGELGDESCVGLLSLKHVLLHEGVTSLHKKVFMGMTIESINIPKSLIDIDPEAFSDSNIQSITIDPDHPVYTLIDGILYKGNTLIACINQYPLETLRIPSFVEIIKSKAFNRQKKIKHVVIDQNVLNIESDAFYVNAVTKLDYKGHSIKSLVAVFGSVDTLEDVSYQHETLPSTFFQGQKSLVSVTLNNVKTIASYAFSNCTSLAKLTIDTCTKHIGDYAFQGCSSLNDIVIPDLVQSIGLGVFKGCCNLKHITMPMVNKYSKTKLVHAFTFGTYFSSIYDSTSHMIKQHFTKDDVRTYYIPKSLEHITMTNGYLTRGVLSGLEHIKTLDIKRYIGDIDAFALYNAPITSLTLSETTKRIGAYALSGTELMDVKLSNDIVNVDHFAFSRCKYLKNFYIGEMVHSFNPMIVYQSPIKNLTLSDHHQTFYLDQNVLINKETQTLVYCPPNLELKVFKCSDSIKCIGAYAFFQQKHVETIVSSHTLERVEDYAFAEAFNLKHVEFNRHTITMGDKIFHKCPQLESLILPKINDKNNSHLSTMFSSEMYASSYTVTQENQNKKIMYYIPTSLKTVTLLGYPLIPNMFMNWTHLNEVKLDDDYIELPQAIFKGCENLKVIHFPVSLQVISLEALSLMHSMTDLDLSKTQLKIIGKNAFSHMRNLSQIILPSTLEIIEDGAFTYIPNLEKMVIPQEVKTIGKSIFKHSMGLKHLVLPFIGEHKNDINHDITYYFGGEPNDKGYVVYRNDYPYTLPTNLSTITLNDHQIVPYAFNGMTSLKKLEGLEHMTYIGDYALSSTGLEVCVIPPITYFGEGAFKDSQQLRHVSFHPQFNLDTLPKHVFEGTLITTIELPTTIRYVQYRAFAQCHDLISITFPNHIDTIDDEVLASTSSLRSLTLHRINQLQKSSLHHLFDDKLTDALYKADYDEHQWFAVPKSLIEITIHQGELSNHLFKNMLELRKIRIDLSINEIPFEAFYGLKNLCDFDIPPQLISIRTSGFHGLESLVMELPKSLTRIEESGLENCKQLFELNLPNLTHIGQRAFALCANLKEVIIPETIRILPSSLLLGAKSLKDVTLPKTLESIESLCFAHCTDLDQLLIPTKTVVSDYAFFMANRMLKLTIESKEHEKMMGKYWNYREESVKTNFSFKGLFTHKTLKVLYRHNI